MFKTVTAFLLLSLFFLPLNIYGIIITEVQIEGESANDCYIKIYNTSSNNIDISGYNLRKKTSSGNDSSIRVFPGGSAIPKNDYFIWASSRNDHFPEKVKADVVSTQTLARNNSIVLLDKNKAVLDSLAWGIGDDQYRMGEEVENPEKGQVIKRVNKDGAYQNTKNNSDDFILYPPALSPLQIKDTVIEYGEKEYTNPLPVAIFSSLLLSLIIFYLNKRWQVTVTQKM